MPSRSRSSGTASASPPTTAATTPPRGGFRCETGIPIYKWDVSDYAACEKGVAAVTRELGPVDVLVNNAGITRDGMLHRMTKENWDAVIRTNLDSVFNMTRLVIDGMRARSYGRIVSISSINGRKGQMGQANYSAAKAGLLGFTKAVAQEGAAKGITCNVIAPGYIATEMVMAVPKDVLEGKILPQIPVGRLGTRRGDRALRGVPRRRGRRLHHRRLPRRQRRAVYGVTRLPLPVALGPSTSALSHQFFRGRRGEGWGEGSQRGCPLNGSFLRFGPCFAAPRGWAFPRGCPSP